MRNLSTLRTKYKDKFDICVFLTCTDLFRSESWIDTAIEKLENNKHLESVFVVSKTHKNFWKIKDNCPERLEEWMKIYSNRQVREPLYREDTGLTCASRSFLWREGRRIGDKVEFIINNNPASMIDIHSLEYGFRATVFGSQPSPSAQALSPLIHRDRN